MEYLTVSDVIEFLCDHEYAGEDFCDFFDVDIWEDDVDELNNRLEADKVLSWVLDHEQLARDLMLYLSDLSEEAVMALKFSDIEEMLAERMGIIHY